VRAPTVVLLMWALACGGRDPSPPPAQPAPPAPPSSPSSPTTPATPGDPAPAPSAPAAVTFERLDASGECDGLVPERAPPAVTIAVAAAGGACGGGVSAGTGHVAVRLGVGADTRWQAFEADGTPRKTFAGWPVLPQPEGWDTVVATPVADGGSRVEHVAIGPDGTARRSADVSSDPALVLTHGWHVAGDPAGGALALVAGTDRFHNHWAGLTTQRFDASGAPRWAAPVTFGARSDPTISFLAAGITRSGEALALWQHSAWLDVAWLDAGGALVAEADLAEPQETVLGSLQLTHDLALAPLLDGGLALRVDGAFRRVYPRLATTSAPPPAWLADRARWSYRFTRGNAGYALFPPAGEPSPGCDQGVELRAPSGRLCGRVVLHGNGQACTTGAVDHGWDGTVVQQASSGACTWRFWPKLLAR
jgi:hypothetical protein